MTSISNLRAQLATIQQCAMDNEDGPTADMASVCAHVLTLFEPCLIALSRTAPCGTNANLIASLRSIVGGFRRAKSDDSAYPLVEYEADTIEAAIAALESPAAPQVAGGVDELVSRARRILSYYVTDGDVVRVDRDLALTRDELAALVNAAERNQAPTPAAPCGNAGLVSELQEFIDCVPWGHPDAQYDADKLRALNLMRGAIAALAETKAVES